MSDLEYFVEYLPNDDEGEQADELTVMEFIGLIADHKSKGIYIKDDHCDWGSSGMNEFTKEFSKNS